MAVEAVCLHAEGDGGQGNLVADVQRESDAKV